MKIDAEPVISKELFQRLRNLNHERTKEVSNFLVIAKSPFATEAILIIKKEGTIRIILSGNSHPRTAEPCQGPNPARLVQLPPAILESAASFLPCENETNPVFIPFSVAGVSGCEERNYDCQR